MNECAVGLKFNTDGLIIIHYDSSRVVERITGKKAASVCPDPIVDFISWICGCVDRCRCADVIGAAAGGSTSTYNVYCKRVRGRLRWRRAICLQRHPTAA